MKNHVAIIGAGPAGLSTARALTLVGVPFTIFEKHADVGGIWDRTNEGSPMYRSAHFISSKTMSGHKGFPMPDTYPDYPSNAQLLSYIRSFAHHYDLYPHIQFNTMVESVAFQDDVWTINTVHDGQHHTQAYRWLVCASGTNWIPNRPSLKGEETFTGEIMHSVGYDNSEFLKNKRVLIVGAGNSGVDIACDAAYMAQDAHISLRRGYHFIPKHIFGMPADVFAQKTSTGPMWLQQRFFGVLLRILNGDLTRLGLPKPDHKVLSSHPIMNTQILHYLQHGDLKPHPDIERLNGNTVYFVDNTTLEVDLIILATGYHWHLPYLPDHIFNWHDDRPDLYLRMFNPRYPTIFVNGYVETNSGIYAMLDDMAYIIAKTIDSQLNDPATANRIQQAINQPEPDLSGNLNHVKSARHTGYVESAAFKQAMKDFRNQFDWASLEDELNTARVFART